MEHVEQTAEKTAKQEDGFVGLLCQVVMLIGIGIIGTSLLDHKDEDITVMFLLPGSFLFFVGIIAYILVNRFLLASSTRAMDGER